MKKVLSPRALYLKKARRNRIKILVIQLSVLVGFIGLWELLAATGVIDSFITSSPSRIAGTLSDLFSQDIMKHIGITLLECVLGFIISTVLGSLIAIALWWSDTLRRVLEPYIVVLNSLPKIALGPVIIVWVGAGMQAIVMMTILICIIVTIMSVLNGFLSCDENKILLLRSMGLRRCARHHPTGKPVGAPGHARHFGGGEPCRQDRRALRPARAGQEHLPGGHRQAHPARPPRRPAVFQMVRYDLEGGERMKKVLSPRALYLKKARRNRIKILVIQLSVLVGFIGLWELLAATGVIDSFITSSPSRIAGTLSDLFSQDIMKHIGITLLECVLGFIISTVLGSLIAIALWWSDTLRRVLEPYIVVLNSLPKIALGPVIIVWVGAGMQAIVMMTILICIIVTIMSVLNGFLSCDENKILLLRSMGASRFQILTRLILPYSLPNFISVLKINVGLAWVGTIMGEYLVSSAGLGYLIIYGGQVFKLDLVMTSTVILCVLAALMYLAVAIVEKRCRRRRGE